MNNNSPYLYADKEFFYLSYMSDKFGWTSDDWDRMTPQVRGNLIANLNYWAERRQKERKKAQEEAKK